MIIKQGPYANPDNYTKGRKSPIEYIVIHFTANDGDTDEGNANYFQGDDLNASANYFVDEDSVTQSVKDEDIAWHCGGHEYFHPHCRNYNSLGVEMCSDKVGGKYIITEATVKLTIELVKIKMKQYNVPLEKVIRHYDVTHKPCPLPWVEKPKLWLDFKESLTKEEEEMTQEQFNQMYANMIAKNNGDNPSPWAKSACEKAKKKKIFTGDGKGNFDWQEPMTKETFCVLLDKMGMLG